jgi:hypothetical protein
VVREDYDRDPGESEDNPDGLPERSIREVRCYEGGPVTFGAYEGATAGVRSISLTDQVTISRAAQGNPERLVELAEHFNRSSIVVPDDISGNEDRTEEETTPAEGISPDAETEEVSDAPSDTEAGPEATSEDERRDPATPKGRKWTFENHERKGLFS